MKYIFYTIITLFIISASYDDGKYLNRAGHFLGNFWHSYVKTALDADMGRNMARAHEQVPVKNFTFQCTASWYSRKECCTTSNPNALMANGQPLNDEAFTCANWDYDFGQRLRVTNKANGNSVDVVVADRGPSIALYQAGRMIDLSKAAFRSIADLRTGIISVKVEELK